MCFFLLNMEQLFSWTRNNVFLNKNDMESLKKIGAPMKLVKNTDTSLSREISIESS
jgi:hypothetical protein